MDRSLDIAGLAQKDCGLDTIMHLTCTNMMQGTVDEALRVSFMYVHVCSIVTNRIKTAKERGIENILALRGGTCDVLSEGLRPSDLRMKTLHEVLNIGFLSILDLIMAWTSSNISRQPQNFRTSVLVSLVNTDPINSLQIWTHSHRLNSISRWTHRQGCRRRWRNPTLESESRCWSRLHHHPTFLRR